MPLTALPSFILKNASGIKKPATHPATNRSYSPQRYFLYKPPKPLVAKTPFHFILTVFTTHESFQRILDTFNQLIRLNRPLQSKLTAGVLVFSKTPPQPVEVPSTEYLSAFAHRSAEIIFKSLSFQVTLVFSRVSAREMHVGVATSTAFGLEGAFQVGLDFANLLRNYRPEACISVPNFGQNALEVASFVEKTDRQRLNFCLSTVALVLDLQLLNVELLAFLVWQAILSRVKNIQFDLLSTYLNDLKTFAPSGKKFLFKRSENFVFRNEKITENAFLVTGKIVESGAFCIAQINARNDLELQISSIEEWDLREMQNELQADLGGMWQRK